MPQTKLSRLILKFMLSATHNLSYPTLAHVGTQQNTLNSFLIPWYANVDLLHVAVPRRRRRHSAKPKLLSQTVNCRHGRNVGLDCSFNTATALTA